MYTACGCEMTPVISWQMTADQNPSNPSKVPQPKRVHVFRGSSRTALFACVRDYVLWYISFVHFIHFPIRNTRLSCVRPCLR